GLSLVEAFVHDLVDRRRHEAGGDPFASAEALAVVHDVAGVVGDIPCEFAKRGRELPQRRRGGVVVAFGYQRNNPPDRYGRTRRRESRTGCALDRLGREVPPSST